MGWVCHLAVQYQYYIEHIFVVFSFEYNAQGKSFHFYGSIVFEEQ